MKSKALITDRKTQAREFRIKQEALWMELDYMLDGQHYVYYDRVSNQVRVVPESQKRGHVRRAINILRAKLRSVANMINKNEPAFNVRATYKPAMEFEELEKAKKDAEVYQHLMTHIYRKCNLRQKFKRIVRMGVKRGMAVAEITWDEEKNIPKVDALDPFDVLIDPVCNGDIQCARYIIKSVLTTKESLREEYYDQKAIKKAANSDTLSGSHYRDSYLQSKYSSEPRNDQVILDEMWEKVYDKNADDEDDCTIKVTSYINEVKVGERKYKTKKYPFVLYYPEEVEGELYPRPYFADLITLNKSVDAINSFVEEYIATVGQGRYLIHQKSKLVTQSTGRHGQFLKWAGNTPPAAMDIPRIPYDVIQGHLNKMEQYMAEIGGMQFLDAEAITRAGTSGVAIAQLQAQQAETVGEPTDNLSYFAKQVFECILEYISSNYTEAEIIPNSNDDSEDIYKVRGKAGLSEDAPTPEEETIVDEDSIPDFKVDIIPGSAFSDLQMRADAQELFQMGLLSKEAVLDAYKIGSIREILDQLQREQEEAMEAQANQQVQQGQINNQLERQKDLSQLQDLLSMQGAAQEGNRRGVVPEMDPLQAMAQGMAQPTPGGEPTPPMAM